MGLAIVYAKLPPAIETRLPRLPTIETRLPRLPIIETRLPIVRPS